MAELSCLVDSMKGHSEPRPECQPHHRIEEGAHGIKKLIKRTAKRLFSGEEHRGLKLIDSIKDEPKKIIYFYLYLYHFSLINSE